MEITHSAQLVHNACSRTFISSQMSRPCGLRVSIRNDLYCFKTQRKHSRCVLSCSSQQIIDTESPEVSPSSSSVDVETSFWKWQGHSIRYQTAGKAGPALVLVHGFGGNCDHWRKNIPVLANQHRVFAIDLLGYGYSDKPSPKTLPQTQFIILKTGQTSNFTGVVGLQAALYDSTAVRGLVLLNISLRMLHIKKQNWFIRPFVKTFQDILRNTDLGRVFFTSVATRGSVKRILCECYYDDSTVTDELVEKILLPGLEPGAVDVFLDFVCYSGGPLPEEMLPEVKCPVLIGWGEKDPWEPVHLGKAYGAFSCVEDFIVFPNVGHCPQDEAPQLVNPVIESFVSRHANIS